MTERHDTREKLFWAVECHRCPLVVDQHIQSAAGYSTVTGGKHHPEVFGQLPPMSIVVDLGRGTTDGK